MPLKRTTFVAACLAPVLALTACEQTPVTGRQQLILISPEQANEMGAQAYRDILSKSERGTDAQQQRVERIGRKIVQAAQAEKMNWEFKVIKDDTANAFALPGGKLGVHTGMLDLVDNDAQLAAVIGHEIAHATARHSAERMSRQALTQAGVGIVGAAVDSQAGARLLAQAAQLGVVLPFTRGQEAEADEIGMVYMARAGYDPHGAVELWQKMAQQGEAPPEFLSTHPNPANRVAKLQAKLGEVMPIYRQNAGR